MRVEHVLLENVVTMVNLGMRRTGLMPGTEDERDLGQVKLAIDSVRALLPQIEQVSPQQAAPIRDAVSQLQMAFVQATGGGTESGGPGADAGTGTADAGSNASTGAGSGTGAGEPQQQTQEPGAPGPAQRSGRLWVPGQ